MTFLPLSSAVWVAPGVTAIFGAVAFCAFRVATRVARPRPALSLSSADSGDHVVASIHNGAGALAMTEVKVVVLLSRRDGASDWVDHQHVASILPQAQLVLRLPRTAGSMPLSIAEFVRIYKTLRVGVGYRHGSWNRSMHITQEVPTLDLLEPSSAEYRALEG